MVQYMVSILYDDDNDNDKDDDGGGDCDDDGANDLRAKYSRSTVEALQTFHHR